MEDGQRVGVVFGYDRKGNAKVRTLDSSRSVGLDGKKRIERREAERSYRDIVLLGSAGKGYDVGAKVLFTVTREGTHVNFSEKYAPGGDGTPPNAKGDTTGTIDLLFFSNTEQRVLAVGTWDNGWIQRLLGPRIEGTGEICERKYALSRYASTYSPGFLREGLEHVREELWVPPSTSLNSVRAPAGGMQREDLVKLIRDGLDCVAKRTKEGMYR